MLNTPTVKMQDYTETAEIDIHQKEILAGGVKGPIGLQLGWVHGWESILEAHRRRSFVSYRKSQFSEPLLQQWYWLCCNNLPWKRPWVGEHLLPRSACWLTTPEAKCKYKYGGMSWACNSMPSWFREITEQVCLACGVTVKPNSCNANYYGTGADMVGWHADNEPIFNAVHQDALIISLSLGGTRVFSFRPNENPGEVQELSLKNGDLCTMEGLMQKHYQHAVLRQPASRDARINLTWRWIVDRRGS